MWEEVDPESGMKVQYVKFRKSRDKSPKAFFDSLNEVGIQYKKLVKDPDALEIICELWRKGEKSRATQLREKNRQESRSRQDSGPSGTPSANFNYMAVPPGRSQPNLISAETIGTMKKHAEEQSWDRLREYTNEAFETNTPIVSNADMERLAARIVRSMGPDMQLYGGSRSVEMADQLKTLLAENIDKVIDTQELAACIIRRCGLQRTASRVGTDVMKTVTATVEELDSLIEGDSRLQATMGERKLLLSAVAQGAPYPIQDPVLAALKRGDAVGAYLALSTETEL
tara:strand:- start:92909 stop:93763 length:855 start_codon:yes stop_codon:yes gene_type:complete